MKKTTPNFEPPKSAAIDSDPVRIAMLDKAQPSYIEPLTAATKGPRKNKHLHILIYPETADALKELSEKYGFPVNELINRALTAYIKTQQAFEENGEN